VLVILENKAQYHIINRQKPVIDRLSASYKNERIGHAYLFDGEHGTGKEATALYFAKLLLCKNPEDYRPCEICNSCRRVTNGNHPNVTITRPDGQQIKKDQIDELIMEMTKKGYEQGRKIYIVSRADRMNSSSANTLLKFLEEPDGDVTAILLTDSYQSMLPTIRSRCQRISFLPPSREMMISALAEKGITNSMAATVTMVTADIEEAILIAQDDAFAHMRKTVLKLITASERNVHEALLFIQSDWSRHIKEKDDTDRALDLLLYAYRDIVVFKTGLQSIPTYPDQQEFFKGLAMKMTYNELSVTMEAILKAKRQMHGNMNRMLLMEQLVLNMQEGLLVV
jgi:DNA polymerase III subunit delta'